MVQCVAPAVPCNGLRTTDYGPSTVVDAGAQAMLKLLFTGRRLWLTLLVLVGALVCCRLAIWQLDRLAQRHAQNTLINQRMVQPAVALDGGPIDPNALDYRRVEARGVYDSA